MISTGEALPRDLANLLLPKGACLWNLYGAYRNNDLVNRLQGDNGK